VERACFARDKFLSVIIFSVIYNKYVNIIFRKMILQMSVILLFGNEKEKNNIQNMSLSLPKSGYIQAHKTD